MFQIADRVAQTSRSRDYPSNQSSDWQMGPILLVQRSDPAATLLLNAVKWNQRRSGSSTCSRRSMSPRRTTSV